jgi:hypothetical protein
MQAYIVTYDLANASTIDYEALFAAIKEYGVWARVTESTWIVATDKTAKEIRDYLEAFLTPGSRLFVVKSGKEAAWRDVRCKNDWLKKWL